MKKLFTTLALAGASLYGANAQITDFEFLISGISDTVIHCTSSDTFYAEYTIVNHGPELVPTGTQLGVKTSGNILTQAYIVELTEDLGVGDTLVLTQALNYTEVNTFYSPTGGEDGTGGLIEGPFTTGEQYGFYVSLAYFEDSPYEDINEGNNGQYINVYWCSTEPSSVFGTPDYNNIAVYPNPTKESINFTVIFDNSTNAIANIYDMTGRLIVTENYGKQAAGSQNFQINVSELPAGNYYMEFITNENKGISKFTVTK